MWKLLSTCKLESEQPQFPAICKCQGAGRRGGFSEGIHALFSVEDGGTEGGVEEDRVHKTPISWQSTLFSHDEATAGRQWRRALGTQLYHLRL